MYIWSTPSRDGPGGSGKNASKILSGTRAGLLTVASSRVSWRVTRSSSRVWCSSRGTSTNPNSSWLHTNIGIELRRQDSANTIISSWGPANQSVNKKINQSINQIINKSNSLSVNQSISKPIIQSISQWFTTSFSQLISQSINESIIRQSVNQSCQ